MSVRSLGRLVPVLLLVALGSARLSAQEATSLAQLNARYQSARQSYEAALSAADAQRLLLDDELDNVNRARTNGDDDALNEAHRRFQTESKELRRLEDHTREVLSNLTEARQQLLDGLDEERMALESQLVVTTDPRRTGILLDLLQGVTSQYREIEVEALELVTATTALFSSRSIVFSDRDGRDELLAKAEILERRVQDADSLVADFDRRIERLESSLRLERNRNDFMGGVERFGDTQLPAIATRPETVREEGVPADSVAMEEDLPLETQVEELRGLQNWLREQQALDRELARQFRERLQQVT